MTYLTYSSKKLKKIMTSLPQIYSFHICTFTWHTFSEFTSKKKMKNTNKIASFSNNWYYPWVQRRAHAHVCLTLSDPVDSSPPDSSVYVISQARILEWVAISSSRGSSDPGIKLTSPVSPAWQVDSLAAEPSGKPLLSMDIQNQRRSSLCSLRGTW